MSEEIKKHAGGRPPYFTNNEDLEKLVNEYFELKKESGEPQTLTGLCLHLGFCSRQTLYEYELKPEFGDTIKKARMRCEQYAESKIFGQHCSGAIFALKNYGWKDTQEIKQDINGNMNNTVKVIFE